MGEPFKFSGVPGRKQSPDKGLHSPVWGDTGLRSGGEVGEIKHVYRRTMATAVLSCWEKAQSRPLQGASSPADSWPPRRRDSDRSRSVLRSLHRGGPASLEAFSPPP